MALYLATTVFITNLPSEVTEFSIVQHLNSFGKITDFSFPVHRDGRAKGKTLGYCFVSFNSKTDAENTIKHRFGGSVIYVRWAKPRSITSTTFGELNTIEYDEDFIAKELSKEEGIIKKDKLERIYERSRKFLTKKTTMFKQASASQSKKQPLDAQAKIRMLENALRKCSSK